jgi:Mrp family chromosome partitioning ATPase
VSEGEAALAIALRHAVIELTRMFDVVICDAAPMSDVAAALPVVAAVERTVVVARANKTKLKALFGFQDVVRQCGGQIGGTVYLDF